MTKPVYLPWHTSIPDGENEDSKLIGVYSSRGQAEGALARTSQLPGFSDNPSGFLIDSYNIDQDNWTEGFVTVRPSND
jgi:hypothetical protein